MIDRDKILKGLLIIAGIIVLVSGLTHLFKKGSVTLDEYARDNPDIAYMEHPNASEESGDVSAGDISGGDSSDNVFSDDMTGNLQNNSSELNTVTLIGKTLNGDSLIDRRTTYKEGFYYEPLSDNLKRYITGVSFPSATENAGNSNDLLISYEDLCYLHVLHYDFEGNPAEGELICNNAIAQDLAEIFYELYYNEYRLEKVRLIDEYDGNNAASMEDNNTSCFNYRTVPGSDELSKHALGLAVDINPLYNPYITYEQDGSENIAPASARPYADRDSTFPYKIDENDLCYKLFKEHGFIWGGDWNNCKDYQHFQKSLIE